MAGSEARRLLSLEIAALGVDGTLVMRKDAFDGVDDADGEGEGADLDPGAALRWPPCECGSPTCPDAGAPAASEAG
ncbi:hypothetical protein AB0O07_16175 [Streptomyces sp. NPDC093085]|uniref:hypothetical protein n=1 Tax=Streptomyces sp. NPDC093085 TaxID=3155068 RepID=UPI00341E3EEF